MILIMVKEFFVEDDENAVLRFKEIFIILIITVFSI